MSEDNKGNWAEVEGREVWKPPQIIITVDRIADFHLNMSGYFPSLDYAINMLDQARRELDAQWRIARMREEQVKMAADAQAAGILKDIRGGGRAR